MGIDTVPLEPRTTPRKPTLRQKVASMALAVGSTLIAGSADNPKPANDSSAQPIQPTSTLVTHNEERLGKPGVAYWDVRQPAQKRPEASPEPAAPSGSEPEPTLSEATYTIQPGDNLLSIAKNFCTTVERLKIDNNLPQNGFIRAGQRLTVRFPSQFGNPTVLPDAFKEAVQQHYYDIEYVGKYYNQDELNSVPQKQEGSAHVYGFNAAKESLLQAKSTGERFDPNKAFVASWFYPLGTKLRITYKGPAGQPQWPKDQWKEITVTVEDRGPNRLMFKNKKDVIIDLSYGAARMLDRRTESQEIGELRVKVELVELPSWYEIRIPLPPARP